MVNDIVVRVSPGQNNGIRLIVTGPPPLLPPAGLGFDRANMVALATNEVAQLRRGTPPPPMAQDVTIRVTQWLLNNDLGLLLQVLLGFAAGGDPLRLVLYVDPALLPALADVPVELVEVTEGPLVLRPQVTALVHLLEKTGPAQPSLVAHGWPLRVLIVRSNPDDLGGRVPAAAPVRDRILAQAGGLGGNAVQVNLLSSEQVAAGVEAPLGPPTWEQVRQRLQRERYDILIYLGHGDLVTAFEGLPPVGALLLELPADATNTINSHAISADQLRIHLQTFPVPVVVLAGCLTAAQPGTPPEQQAFLDEMLPAWMRGSQGVAQALVNGDCGVQFAVGMRYRLERGDAEAFLDAFFQSVLVDDLGNVEAAVRAGRLKLFGDHPFPPSWSAPVVFRTLGREPMFDFMRKPPAAARDPRDERDQVYREMVWQALVKVPASIWTTDTMWLAVATLARAEGDMRTRAQTRGPWLKPGQVSATPGSTVTVPVALNGQITADRMEGTFTVLGENVRLLTARASQALHDRGYQLQPRLAVPNELARLAFYIDRTAGAAVQPLPEGVIGELEIFVGQGFNVFYPVQAEVTAVTPHAQVGGGNDAILVPPP